MGVWQLRVSVSDGWCLPCNPTGMQTKGLIRLWKRQVARLGGKMPAAKGQVAATTPNFKESAVPGLEELLRDTLRRDLSLAAEHVHSIRWLLAIAREHQQPIPTAALKNLELVTKSLCEMRRRIGGEEFVPESEISAVARRPELRTLPRPRRPSFGCRASPSDRSTPFD